MNKIKVKLNILLLVFIIALNFNSMSLSIKDNHYYNKKDYYKSTWQWLDINSDGVYECYYFNFFGHMLKNGKTPDGYYVNEEGQWVVDGAVQYRTIFEVQTYVYNAGSSCASKVEEIKIEFNNVLDTII